MPECSAGENICQVRTCLYHVPALALISLVRFYVALTLMYADLLDDDP